MTGQTRSAAQITQRARSNLAYALFSLPRERRHDMITFYAFCRVVDDIADDDDQPADERRARLEEWKQIIQQDAPAASSEPLLDEVRTLIPKYGIDPALLLEIIDGVASDLTRSRFETYMELLRYCYQVASAVGLVSIRIFGGTHPASEKYAIHLGYALQLTNILRDVGQDARDTGRIYLPLEDLRTFGVSEQQILEQRYDTRFRDLMEHQYQRALQHYHLAENHLRDEDRRTMVAAEMMAQIYFEILLKLKRLDFRVFDKRIGLHPLRKGLILLSYLIRPLIGAV